MHSARRSSVAEQHSAAKVAEVSPPSLTVSSPPSTANGRLPRTASSLGCSPRTTLLSRQASTAGAAPPVVEPVYTPEADALALIKSFRRKKYIRTRLLLPLQSNDDAHHQHQQQQQQYRRWSPRKTRMSPRTQRPLTVEQQCLVERIPSDRASEPSNREEDEDFEDDEDDEIEELQRVHALLASQDEIDHWIASYETEKTQFTSFALFTELKLDEIQDKYVALAKRPNAVEAAACCATLLKMPGIVGCYRTLLDKIARGIESVVYLPIDDPVTVTAAKDDSSMATLVQSFYTRKPYFQRMHELEMQLRQAKSLTDPAVIRALTVEELTAFALHAPVRKMTTGIIQAYAQHLPHLDHLLAMIHEKKHQLQLAFYQLHGHTNHHHHRHRNAHTPRRASGLTTGDADEFDGDELMMDDDADYPITVPLTSSAQICRAISQHAAAFSASGKEMILCSILEHIEVESFKDVFKRFDAHGKTCFLHFLSVCESSDHLQLILEQLPNAGETLFRFYYVICGGGGSGSGGSGTGANPKHVFFQKLLSAEMEFFFLCDLAGFLNDEQWLLLSQEYEKNAQERKARRKRLRNRRRLAGAAGGGGSGSGAAGNGEYGGDDGDDDDDGDEDGGGGDGGDNEATFQLQQLRKKTMRSGSTASLEHFQLMVWNYLHHHKCTSAQIWALVQNVLFPSLEEAESLACIDHCMERMAISSRWQKMLALVTDMEADTGAGSGTAATAGRKDELVEREHEIVRHTRLKMLKTLFAMLSREERAIWMDKTTAKYGVLTNKPAVAPPPVTPVVTRKQEVVVAVQAPPARPNLDDPTQWMAHMKLDVKMLWIEALLTAIASDKETSARTAMLKQMLVPFLNGQSPPPPVVSETPQPQPKATVEIKAKMTLVEAERAIGAIVAQLKQHHPSDESKLWQTLIPESMRAAPVPDKTDRALSPIPEVVAMTTTKEPPSKPTPTTPTLWWEATTPNQEIVKAFRALVEVKTEAEVLRLLQHAIAANKNDEERDEFNDHDQDHDHERAHGSASFRNSVKRKLSAVVAVSEPMEWQERVKIGMLDMSTQTDLVEVSPSSATSTTESNAANATTTTTTAVAVARAPLTLHTLLGRQANDKGVGGGGTSGAGGSSPRRKNDAKFQKLNSAAVPRAIAGLITSWRVNTDQLVQFAKKPLPTVLRLIADAYGEMLTAGRRKANYLATTATTSSSVGTVVVASASSATATGHRGSMIKELTLAQIVYQQFLHSYGLPAIADMHLLAFSCALDAYRVTHLRVEFFARFVFEEVAKSELGNFVEFLECLVCDDATSSSTSSSSSSTSGGTSGTSGTTPGGSTAASSSIGNTTGAAQGPVTTKRQRFVPRIAVPDKENWMVPLEKAQEAAQLCFRAMRKQAVVAFCDKLAMLAAQGASSFVPAGAVAFSPAGATTLPALPDTGRSSPMPFARFGVDSGLATAAATATTGPAPPVTTTTAGGTTETLQINADHLLQLVVSEWRDEQLRRESHLLNVFRAGDVNGDGELTSAEFTHIVRAIDHTRDLGDILLMYSDTLRRTQCEAIDAEVFLQVAKEYELDRAAWHEDGELRNIVNDMHELTQTWLHTRSFFVGTLEALARDLPSRHFLRVCEGAGCGCLKCILDGYIGFQRMRREYFYNSSNKNNNNTQPTQLQLLSTPPSPATKHQQRTAAVSEALLWARFWHLMRQLYEAASESPGILTPWQGADYMRVEPAPRPPPRYLKYRRMALPNFLFPDTDRISGKMDVVHEQLPEVFDKETILQQFAGLTELMTFTTPTTTATTATTSSSIISGKDQ